MLEDKDLVSIEEVRAKVEKPYAAWLRYRLYNQEQIDSIVERMAAAATSNGPCIRKVWHDTTQSPVSEGDNPSCELLVKRGTVNQSNSSDC